LSPILYQKFSTGILRDIRKGTIGAYDAKVGWDACTGLGSPDGVNLLNALKGP
jgi:kumamolisin